MIGSNRVINSSVSSISVVEAISIQEEVEQNIINKNFYSETTLSSYENMARKAYNGRLRNW